MEKLEYFLTIYIHRIKAIAWIILYLWIAQPILFDFFSIDFSEFVYRIYFSFIWIFLVPLAFSTILYYNSYIYTKFLVKINTSFIIFHLLVFCMLIFTFIANFVNWNFTKPLYTNIHNNKTIRYRNLNAGATDSHPVDILVETTPITNYFYFYKEISQNDIDTTVWKRVESDY